MSEGLNDSRFYMWRAVVAMAHADGVVTPHEMAFINDYIKDMSLSAQQLEIIGQDLHTPQDTYEMFAHISDLQDKRDFFALARALSWCDGDYDEQEKHIIDCLEESHIDNENRNLLEESREIINEVELCQNQWKFKTERSENLLGFLNKTKIA